MQYWYQTKEGCSIQHGGQIIEPPKKIFLPEDLAVLHNSMTEQIVICPPPADITEAALKSDFYEYQASITPPEDEESEI